MAEGLRRAGSVLLVSTYELGHQPMGLAMPAAFLRRAGFSPACVDTSVEPLAEELIRRARLVAISAPMHTALRLGVRVARLVRRANPGARVVFFGDYSWLNRHSLLAGDADFVIGGECEQLLVDLAFEMEAVQTGGQAGNRGVESASKLLERLSFPVPSRVGLPAITCYARLRTPTGELGAGHVAASRGCKYHCAHCPIPPVYKGRFFVVPRDVVLSDIRNVVEEGAGHISFGDPDFLNAPGHSKRIAQELHEEFPGLTFDFTAKVEHLRRFAHLLPEFARLGCVFIVTAAESLNDTVLRILRKGHTRADFETVVSRTRESGIVLRPSWVPFTPWSTLEDYLEVFAFAEAEQLVSCIDPIQYTIRLLVPPGSPLVDAPEMQPHFLGLDSERFTYQWGHPDPRMDRLHLSVSQTVEQAVACSEEAGSLFGRLRELALSASDHGTARNTRAAPWPTAMRTYGLTEPWFC